MAGLQKMKLLIIGHTGQVGRELVNLAKQKKIDYLGLSRPEIDVTDEKSIKRVMGSYKPSVVINTAAYHVVSACEDHPDEALQVNVTGSLYLSRNCSQRGIQLVTYSTDKVFDGTKGSPYREEDCSHPIQMYGVSMLAREHVTQTYSSDSLIIRTCGILGGTTGSKMKGGNFVLYILRETKIKQKLEMSSDQSASIVNAQDLARATLDLLKKKKAGIFHIVNEGYCTWAELAEEIVRIRRLSMKIIPVDRSGSYAGVKIPSFNALSIIKLQSTGVAMSGWKDGLRRYLMYLKKQGI